MSFASPADSNWSVDCRDHRAQRYAAYWVPLELVYLVVNIFYVVVRCRIQLNKFIFLQPVCWVLMCYDGRVGWRSGIPIWCGYLDPTYWLHGTMPVHCQFLYKNTIHYFLQLLHGQAIGNYRKFGV